jgi:hypothetical protein
MKKIICILLCLSGFLSTIKTLRGQILKAPAGATISYPGSTRVAVTVSQAASSQTLSTAIVNDTLRNIDYTIVAGGGGGAGGNKSANGGGGGGQILNSTGNSNSSVTAITYTVGAGGAGGAGGAATGSAGSPGASSSITISGTTVTANGGSGGIGPTSNNQASGGSGGVATGGTAAAGGTSATAGGADFYGGGGGFGSGGATPTNASNASTGAGGGDGGFSQGIINAVGVNTQYGGGGGGGASSGKAAGSAFGGGGAGGQNQSTGTSGTNGTGGGGGGGGGGNGTSGSTAGGAGGSGGTGTVIVSVSCYDLLEGTNVFWCNATGHTTGLRTACTGTVSIGSGFAVTSFNDNTADIYLQDCNLTVSGTLNCRNLYVNGSSTITMSGSGSINCTTIFYSGGGATNVLPDGLTCTNLYILGWNTTTNASLPCTVTLGGITATRTITNLFINNGSKLNLNGFALTLTSLVSTYSNGNATMGTMTGSGAIIGSATSALIYNGLNGATPTLYMDQTTDGTTNRLKKLTLNSPSTGTYTFTIPASNKLYFQGGNSTGELLLGSGVTLISNTTGASVTPRVEFHVGATGEHCIIDLQGGQISGEVMYEDFFTAGARSFRQFGTVIDSTGISVNQITDDVDLYADITAGTGRSSATRNINGFYESSAAATNSIYYYNESNYPNTSRWVALNGNTQLFLERGKGYMMFLRPLNSGTSGNYNSATIDYEGQPNTVNDVVVTTTFSSSLTSPTFRGGLNLLSNPYPSYLNYGQFAADNASSLQGGSSQSFYKYDRTLRNYKATANSGGWKNSSGTPINPHIDPGDGIFVQIKVAGSTAPNGPSLTFKRTQTTFTKETNLDRLNKLEVDSTLYSVIHIKMRSKSDSTIGDEATIINSSWGKGSEFNIGDALNINGTCLDLSIVCSTGEKAAFKTISNKSNSIIPLSVNSCSLGKYKFAFNTSENKPGADINYFLIDNYLKSKTQIQNETEYDYEINSDSNSFGTNRFFISSSTNSLASESKQNGKETLIFPNPSLKDGHLVVSKSHKSKATILLYDCFGRIIFNIVSEQDEEFINVNLSNYSLSTGVYWLDINSDLENKTIPVVIK